MASTEGMQIIIGRRNLDECIVSFHFSKSPKSLELIAAPLLAEILEKNGTAAPEVLVWEVTSDDNSLSLKGPITEATLSGLMGIFSLQSQAARATAGSLSMSQDTQEKQMGYRTQSFFNDVNEIVERTRKHKSQTTGALAAWNDKRARQIEELGTLNVDPEMVQYGVQVSSLLRGNALTVRKGLIATGQDNAANSATSGYGYDSGYYGYRNVNNTGRINNARQTINSGNAYANYQQTLSAIDELMSTTRRQMTDKYKMQF